MDSQRPYTPACDDPTVSPSSSTEAFGAGRHAGNGHGTDGVPPAEAFKQASARLGELKEYASLYVAAKLDGLKLTLRNIVLYAVLGLVGAIAGVTMIVTATVYLLSGLAGAIGEIALDPYEWWTGRLIVGALVLGVTFGGIFFLMKRLTGSSRKRTIEKYEDRKRTERQLYGHDVQERAREQARRQAEEQQQQAHA